MKKLTATEKKDIKKWIEIQKKFCSLLEENKIIDKGKIRDLTDSELPMKYFWLKNNWKQISEQIELLNK